MLTYRKHMRPGEPLERSRPAQDPEQAVRGRLQEGASSFGALLRELRVRSGLSQRALARATAINPAIVNRFEQGERGPSGPEQVLAIVQALRLARADGDRLLASAGFWPASLLDLGPADETLLGVAQVLTAPNLSPGTRARFRQVLALLIEQWTAP